MVNKKLSDVIQRLWDLNENKLTRNVDYDLNIDEGVDLMYSMGKSEEEEIEDEIEELEKKFKALFDKTLFKSLDFKKIYRIPTFRTFVKLLDNYVPDTETEEEETNEEDSEQKAFLNACLATPLMKEAHRFLVSEGKAPEDYDEFRDLLEDIWFEFYSRSAKEERTDSSAFEHVFVGEKSGSKKVLGFHNWIDYYFMERKGEVKYLGYIPSKSIYEDEVTDDPAVIAFKFTYMGVFKPIGGFLIGMSPEFELAMYTIIFLCSGQKTHLKFANLDVTFECFKMERGGKRVIATLFPTI